MYMSNWPEETFMKHLLKTFTPALLGAGFIALNAPLLNAQITNQIRAKIDHSFVIGNTTLPPGEYTFRMQQDSNLSLMNVSSDNDKTSIDFLVRQAIDDHRPNHSELVFRKYGNTEFLSKIFETGSKNGAEVTETSREEARFAKQGKQASEHTEEQQQ
jgi:hypothetical protein